MTSREWALDYIWPAAGTISIKSFCTLKKHQEFLKRVKEIGSRQQESDQPMANAAHGLKPRRGLMPICSPISTTCKPMSGWIRREGAQEHLQHLYRAECHPGKGRGKIIIKNPAAGPRRFSLPNAGY